VTGALETLVGFGRALRDEGLGVGTDRIASFCTAAALVPAEELYWAGRATLVSREQDLPVYDRVFARFFGRDEQPLPRPRARVQAPPVAVDAALASSVELLREKSFARCTPEELAQVAELMRRLPLVAPERRSRRRAASRRPGAFDLRRTLRRSLRTGGEPATRLYRERRRKRRRVVLLLDVSGSMADYSRALVLFAHAALRGHPDWETFCFGTRLTRLTRALRVGDPNDAFDRAAREVMDWEGGTRIGESLKSFLDLHGHHGLARGAVAVICSDGLDVGDPDLLAEQMARLARLTHRVIWLNPLKEHPAYEPLARGMHAALPHVDVFASGHNLASLEDLAAELGRSTARR
jgi:uncharacterized protein with von Willebrand factor type A (vWA) domain